MAADLPSRTMAVVAAAHQRAATPEAASQLSALGARLDGPLRLAIAGKVKAGKSTLLNALIGEELAPTDAGECTRIVTWYAESHAPRVTLHARDGEAVDVDYRRGHGALDVDLGGRDPAAVERLAVDWPTSRLRDIVLIDTPGIASISGEVSARTEQVMSSSDGRIPVADGVLYLLRHAHASDVRFLESFHDDELAHGTPMNAVGVLSRADEIGSCRLDALEVAERVSRRYQGDDRLRRLCPVVVPVSGLLGYAATTLREAEFSLLATIAAAPSAEVTALLLTADRFVGRPTPIAVTPHDRAELMSRLGLFGVRLAVHLISTGTTPDAVTLARELTRRSGIERLRDVLLRQFQDRSRILKSRSALVGVETIVRSGGCRDDGALRAMLEELQASAHEFAEVRVLSLLRIGEIDLNPERTERLDRLLGGSGHDVWSRLDLAPEANSAARREAALASLTYWRAVADHPLSSRSTRLAASTATRTVEGVLADGAAPDTPR